MNQDIEPQRFNSNVAIHAHSMDPVQYGDGSLEVQGRIYVDLIQEYSPDTGTVVSDILLKDGYLQIPAKSGNVIAVPQSGKGSIFYDSLSNTLRIKRYDGNISETLNNKGSLFTHDGFNIVEMQTVAVPNDYHLVIDKSTSNGLAWKAVEAGQIVQEPIFGKSYAFIESATESNTNAQTFIVKTVLTGTVTTGKYRCSVKYNWHMSSANKIFHAQVAMVTGSPPTVSAPHTNGTVVYNHKSFESGSNVVASDISNIAQGTALLDLTTGTYSFVLRYKSDDNNHTAFISNVVIELWRVF